MGSNKEAQEIEWLQVFLPLHEKARVIVQKVGKSVRSEDEDTTLPALKEAVEKLPPILDEMKAAPNPKEKELKEIRKKFEKGFKEFIDSCNYGVAYCNKPTRWNQSVWFATADSAAKKLEDATIHFSQYSNK